MLERTRRRCPGLGCAAGWRVLERTRRRRSGHCCASGLLSRGVARLPSSRTPVVRFSKAGRLEKEANITRPRDQETTNRYNENDIMKSPVCELAFGMDICSGSEG